MIIQMVSWKLFFWRHYSESSFNVRESARGRWLWVKYSLFFTLVWIYSPYNLGLYFTCDIIRVQQDRIVIPLIRNTFTYSGLLDTLEEVPNFVQNFMGGFWHGHILRMSFRIVDSHMSKTFLLVKANWIYMYNWGPSFLPLILMYDS